MKKTIACIGLIMLMSLPFGMVYADEADDIYTFEEQTLADNDDCIVIITGIDEDNSDGYTLNTYLENKSDDAAYLFEMNDIYVNGLEIDSFLIEQIDPLDNTDAELIFSSLDDYDIDEVTYIAFNLHIYDADAWTSNDIVNEQFHIYPVGEENAVKYQREDLDTDIVLVDTDDVSATITGFGENDLWGDYMEVFLDNKTETDVVFSSADILWSKTIPAGECAYSSIFLGNTDLEDGMEVELSLQIFDKNDITADDFFNDTVNVTVRQ